MLADVVCIGDLTSDASDPLVLEVAVAALHCSLK